MDKARILVVDDDVEMQNVLPIFLKRILDCDVVVTGNGSDAIRELDSGTFQMIVQDLQMPGMDGFSVLAHAVKRQPRMVRIVLTGIVDPAITRRVESMGATYVSKPPELNVLKLIIKRELGRYVSGPAA
ncbi:MAG: response regulator [Candidatus Omnitrophica bacterium]|nr:response regulator [Candidatus Omnitrophota bacterium]